MRAKLFISWAMVLLVLASVAATAQERRTIPVTVVDKQGKIVEGLTAANFRAEYRGSALEVLAAEMNTEPRVIGIAVDTSASLSEVFKRDANWQMAEELIDRFSPRHSVGLYSFGKEVRVGVEPTNDKPRLVEKLTELKENRAKGSTAYRDAVYTVAESLPRNKFGNVIYFITDGIDTSSMHTSQETDIAVLRSGSRVIVLCLPEEPRTGNQQAVRRPTGPGIPAALPPSPVLPRIDSSDCRRLPKITGGYTIFVGRRRNVPLARLLKSAEPFHERIERVYAVELELPASIVKRRKLRLQVVDENGKKMKGVKVHYPRYLVPLEEPQPESAARPWHVLARRDAHS